MKKKIIKNVFFLIIILYVFYLNNKIQIIVHQNKLITNEIKISVIIPIYNGGKYLNYSLRSIQTQKMKDIEIIIVDDNSSDDSLEIIQNYMKNDSRIKLIKNNETRRILFCKSIGVLNSRGKYIIELDQDDMFISDDAFDILFEESEKYELDLLNFDYIYSNDSFESQKVINRAKNKNIIQKIPKPKFSILKENLCLLWGNLIKADLYKMVIYNLWPIIINYQIIFQEDFLITFFILIYAKRYEKIKNILYFHFKNIKSISNDYKKSSEYYLSLIFAGNVFFDYYIDYHSKDIQNLINYIYNLKEDFRQSMKFFPTLLNYFFGKIFSKNQLSKRQTKKIMRDFNISENCDSYLFLDENQSFNMSVTNKDKPYFYNKKNQSLELSIIIVCSDYEKIIKIINPINTQHYEYFEIILIYDDEDKRNYNLLYNYIKSYYHIQLIDNGTKKGTFFSIIKGVMLAKGKYLLILDQNYFFISNNTIQNIYKEIDKDDPDIFEFNLYKILPNNYINIYKCKHFISRFNLTKIKYNLEYDDIDIKKELLTNKLFRADYFKNIIDIFNLDKINGIIDYYHNNIFEFIIQSIPHKYKHINSVNLFVNDIDCDKSKFNDYTSKENTNINETIFYINFLFDNTKETYESKEKALKEYLNHLSIIYNKFTPISEISLQLYNKFISCQYISKENKILLKFYYKSLVN